MMLINFQFRKNLTLECGMMINGLKSLPPKEIEFPKSIYFKVFVSEIFMNQIGLDFLSNENLSLFSSNIQCHFFNNSTDGCWSKDALQ